MSSNASKNNNKAPVNKADSSASESNEAGMQAQQDAKAQEQAAAADDSSTIPHEKDTSLTAAMRK